MDFASEWNLFFVALWYWIYPSFSHREVDEAKVRKAYFRMAQKYHPDKNPDGRVSLVCMLCGTVQNSAMLGSLSPLHEVPILRLFSKASKTLDLVYPAWNFRGCRQVYLEREGLERNLMQARWLYSDELVIKTFCCLNVNILRLVLFAGHFWESEQGVWVSLFQVFKNSTGPWSTQYCAYSQVAVHSLQEIQRR